MEDMEERFGALEDTIQRLVQGLANVGLFPNNQIDRPLPNPTPTHQEDRTIWIDVLDFDGCSHDPNHYLEWEEKMDHYFEFKETPHDRQFKLAKVKTKKTLGREDLG